MMFSCEKKKPFLFCTLALTLVAALFVSVFFAAKVYAKDPKKTITAFLNQKDISYSDLNVSDGILSVKLLSDGENYSTVDDIKAIQTIYEAVHAQTVDGKIRDVSIEIYDIAGKSIFDEYQPNVSSPIENIELLTRQRSSQEAEDAEKDILLTVDALVNANPFEIQSVSIEPAEELSGEKLVLTLSEEEGFHASGVMISIYEQLEAYALSTGNLTQCEITVLNPAGDCVLYTAGDFRYGNCITWISPEEKDTFIAAEGPAPVDE